MVGSWTLSPRNEWRNEIQVERACMSDASLDIDTGWKSNTHLSRILDAVSGKSTVRHARTEALAMALVHSPNVHFNGTLTIQAVRIRWWTRRPRARLVGVTVARSRDLTPPSYLPPSAFNWSSLYRTLKLSHLQPDLTRTITGSLSAIVGVHAVSVSADARCCLEVLSVGSQ
jgi:hypothetical protein